LFILIYLLPDNRSKRVDGAIKLAPASFKIALNPEHYGIPYGTLIVKIILQFKLLHQQFNVLIFYLYTYGKWSHALNYSKNMPECRLRN
jgi:hypothetical protein